MTSRSVLIVVTALAISCSEVAAAPLDAPVWGYLLLGPALAGVAWVVGLWLRRSDESELAPTRVSVPLLVAAFVLPWIMEPFRQTFIREGRPLEVLLIDTLRNLLVVLTILRDWPVCVRLGGLCSLFLVLFAAGLIGEPPVLPWLMAGYAAAATWWMVLAYWDRVRAASGDEGLRPPLAGLIAVFLLVGVFLAVGLAGPMRAARVLAELVPTSGGTGSYDPHSRGGVNDGEEETRGANAQSAGFLETDVFIEDDRPSLYDVVNEQAGEPFRKPDSERAIPLTPEQMIEAQQRPAENLGGRREFSTSRRAPPNARQPSDVDTRALFYVVGRVPLHLRMNVHDHFDGVSWREARHTNQVVLVQNEEPGQYWMRLDRARWPDWMGPSENHELRFARLKSYQFPTPPQLMAFRLGKVDQSSFFGWMNHGVLRLRDRTIPTAVSLHTETRSAVPEKLEVLMMGAFMGNPDGRYLHVPGVDSRIEALAKEWAGEGPTGMGQVRRIEQALRRHAELDWTVSCPEDRRDSVSWFLFESRRGPDYLFASALVVMLRSQGYPARLASGFYADPARYEVAKDHTAVVPEDLHFWAEVLVSGDGEWVVLEPTPGYEVLGPAPTWMERLGKLGLAVLGWMWERVAVLGGMLVLGVGLWLGRYWLLDLGGRWWWAWQAKRGWRSAVLGALWLLERRARWAGGQRPAHHGPSRWQQDVDAEAVELQRLAVLADWAAYAPEGCTPGCAHGEAVEVCEKCLQEWTVARFRRSFQGVS